MKGDIYLNFYFRALRRVIVRSPTPFGTMRSRNALSEKGQRRSMLLTRLGYRNVAAQS